MTKYFKGTPEEERLFRTLHLTYDLWQRFYGLTKKEKDREFVDSLRQAARHKELTAEQRFNAIVDGLLRQMTDDIPEHIRNRDESFTFKRWVV